MKQQNGLKRFDKDGIAAIETAFREGVLADAAQRAPHIQRVRGVSAEDFAASYRKHRVPVLMEGTVDHWPALQKWSFTNLTNRCGERVVTVDGYNSEKARPMKFKDFADLLSGSRRPTEPVYLQEWYYKVAAPEIADDLPELEIGLYDFRRHLYGEEASTNHQLWLGQAGGVTILHQDSYMVDVMHVQLVGEKRWYVMSPQADLKYLDDGSPDWQGLIDDPTTELMQCTLKPGDVLYLPALWWHRIELLSDSIGLGRKCLDPENLQTHIKLRMGELLALALNADGVRESHPELFGVVVKRAHTFANRLGIDLAKLRP